MSSPETTMKRKAAADGHQGGGDCESNAATDEGATTLALASILAEMKDMRLEMKDMKGRTNELESKCQMQEKNMDKLKSKCKMLEVKCDSLERSMQILIKEQKYEYSGPYIPTSHWIDQGLDVDYIEGMEHLLRQVKDGAIELRSGKDNIKNDIF